MLPSLLASASADPDVQVGGARETGYASSYVLLQHDVRSSPMYRNGRVCLAAVEHIVTAGLFGKL